MTAFSETIFELRKSREVGWLLSTAGAALLFALLALLGVVLRPPLPVDETRYLAVAWEMYRDKNLFVPHLNGAIYSQKPPLLFWLIDALWSVTGTSGFAARLVAPFFGLVSIFLTALLARRLWPEDAKIAARAPWILATSGLFLAYGSLTMFDTLLMAATLLALLGLLEQRQRGGWAGWPLVGLAVALGVLAKGPAIVVHVVPLALLAPLWMPLRSRAALFKWYGGFALAMLAAMGIVALWFLPAVLAQGEHYLEAVVWNQGAGRVVSSFAHQKPIWFFAAFAPLFLWPWGWSRKALATLSPKRLWREQAGRFCLIWIGAAFVIHSAFSGKQLHYLLPELPALAILIARADWQDAGEEARSRRLLALAPLLLALPLVWAARFGMIAPLEGFFAALPLPLLLLASLGAALFAYLNASLPRRIQASALVAPGALLLLYILATPVLQGSYNGLAMGEALARHEKQGLAYFGSHYSGEFTFQGRLTRPLERLSSQEELLAWTKDHPGGAVIAKGRFEGLSWPPALDLPYRGSSYLLWEVPEQAADKNETAQLSALR